MPEIIEPIARVTGQEMRLRVKYEGLAADRGRMNALDLGPAIFGLAEMYSAASRHLYKDDSGLRVDVRADFEHASFGIEFLAVSPAGIGGLTWEQLAHIGGVLGIVGNGLVFSVAALLKWQRGRAVDRVEQLPGGDVKISIHDESQVVHGNVYNIFTDTKVRAGFKALVDPMKREGVDTVSFQQEKEAPVSIDQSEREAFSEPPLPQTVVSLDESTAILEIVSISFREGNKWRFSQGDMGSFHADILDESFLARVASKQQAFASGDALRVRLQIETTRESGQLRYTRRILEVLEYLSGEGDNGQLPLV